MDMAVCLRCRQLDRRVAELQADNQRLRQLLQEAQRAGKRQAAPFSKGNVKKEPKPPGRKPGKDYGPKAHRSAPPPKHIDETYEAPLPDACPDCGGPLEETHVEQQFQVEIPRQPIHRQFNIHIGQCQCCQRRVQGRHQLQTSDALGAAASQLGPDAQAAVVELNKNAGLAHGKVVQVLNNLFGISLSRGGSAQVVLRAGRRCEPVYQGIVRSLRRSDWVVGDETGWRLGGLSAWLHTLVGPFATAFVIDPSRGHEPAADILGLDYDGQFVHDGWAPYDQFQQADHQQCNRHILNRCAEILETARGGSVHFPRRVAELLRQGLDLRDRYEAGQISRHGLAVACGRLQYALEDAVFPPKTDPTNERLAQHLWNHMDELFTFLRVPGLDATNWRAEHAIRFGVILRKVWGGNRTSAGARAQSVLMSVWRTCWQRARNALNFLSGILRRRIVPVALPP